VSIIYGRADSEKRLLDKYPGKVKKIEDIPEIHDYYKQKLKENSGIFGFFKKWNTKRQLYKIENSRRLYKGAKGENRVLEELAKLGDDYHVLCGLRMWLPYTVNYRGEKNLKSAQMDFVVVCKKGIFLIEVKNWSDEYLENYERNPYEQTERAGRVLWISLDNVFSNLQVTNILLSISGNIPYDDNYKVFVTSLERINWFLQKKDDILNDNDVKKIVSHLKWNVTK
jgi:hypothetical protein